MDHSHFARIQACSRYLVGELSAEEAEAFEEHYFCCQECSEEVKLGEVFADSLRGVFREESLPVTAPSIAARVAEPTWFERFRMSFVIPIAATACVLSFVVYQNTLTIPSLRTEVALMSEPQTVPAVVLKLARGGDESVQLPKSPYWMPYFFLSKSGQFSSYFCDIETSAGRKLKTLALAVPAPGQPFAILLRRSDYPSGAYVFRIRGNRGDNTPVATYTLNLKD